MIAADTSSLVSFFQGDEGPDVSRIEAALANDQLFMAPPVIAELLAKPKSASAFRLIEKLERLELLNGYWERAGTNRALLLSRGLKARFADALIAQCCIDSDVALITRDADYRHFARWCGLKLVVEP